MKNKREKVTMKCCLIAMFLLLTVMINVTVRAGAPLSAIVETVLQNINEDEQTKTPANQQSGVLPLNIDAIRKNSLALNSANNRWSGKYERTYYGIVTVPIPKTDLKKDIRPMLRNRAILLAVNEAAFYKMAEKYIFENATLFSDNVLLLQALNKTSANHQFNGTHQKTAEFTYEIDGSIVGVVAVLDENIDVVMENQTENSFLKTYWTLLQQKVASDTQSENFLLKEYIRFLQQKLQSPQPVTQPVQQPPLELPDAEQQSELQP